MFRLPFSGVRGLGTKSALNKGRDRATQAEHPKLKFESNETIEESHDIGNLTMRSVCNSVQNVHSVERHCHPRNTH